MFISQKKKGIKSVAIKKLGKEEQNKPKSRTWKEITK